jgi:mannose-6-phosphate isomerase-like protein (cupin superfamily)
MTTVRFAVGAIALAVTLGNAFAQTPPPKRPRVPTASSTQIIVRDVSGTPLQGVRITVSGPADQQLTTDATGNARLASPPPGTYRLRFEHEGFVMLEREVSIKNGQPSEIDVALTMAPAPPPPPPPPPTPPRSEPAAAGGLPAFVSIPAFLDHNFIGRDPLKESVLGCTPSGTTRLLQLRDNLATHTHDGLDETVYVVAGEGAVRIREESTPVAPGSLSIIPRGAPHGFERRGKNPLILLSMLSGQPCQPK